MEAVEVLIVNELIQRPKEPHASKTCGSYFSSAAQRTMGRSDGVSAQHRQSTRTKGKLGIGGEVSAKPAGVSKVLLGFQRRAISGVFGCVCRFDI